MGPSKGKAEALVGAFSVITNLRMELFQALHPTLFLFYEYSVSVIVTEHTNYSLETIMAWYRGFKEDCPDGRLTPQAFMHVYGSSFVSANTKEFCDYVFRNFDKDGNGYIDFKEFLLAIHVTSSGSAEDKLKWAFR